jgi:titin
MTFLLSRLAASLGSICRGRASRKPRGLRPRLESLEDRLAPATFTVTTAADNGDDLRPTAGSLRQQVLRANANPGVDTIQFRIGSGGAQAIQVPTTLPALVGPVVFDGINWDAVAGHAQAPVELTGLHAGRQVAGDALHLLGGSSTVKGMIINGFTGAAVHLDGAGNNVVTGCYLGTDRSGTAARPTGNGVLIDNSPGNTIGLGVLGGGNVISGNTVGVLIWGAQATGNKVQRNRIGTTANGTAALPNGTGILIEGSPGNLIGGTSAGYRNIISGNAEDVQIYDRNGSAAGNKVWGNYIGTDASGTRVLGDSLAGVVTDSPGTIIGGTSPGCRNVISGHVVGVEITSGAAGSVVEGNYIGTDASGQVALGNSTGVLVAGAPGVLIGGTAASAGNLISGNTDGVYLSSDGCSVRNNTIAFNGHDGVFVALGQGNVILSNAIFGNGHLGIELEPGANGGLSAPHLGSAVLLGTDRGKAHVTGDLQVVAGHIYTIEFFASPGVTPAAQVQGQRPIGQLTFTARSSDLVHFTLDATSDAAVGEWVTATVTDQGAGTSAFSAPVRLTRVG